MLAVLAVIVTAAATRPVIHGAEVVLQIVIITVAITAGLAVTAAVAYAAFRIRRWRASTRPARQSYRLSAQGISAARRNTAVFPVIEASRPRVTTEDGIIRIAKENR